MIIKTERLILRPWEESDAGDLFRYASDPDIGPAAGWPAHKSEEESLEIIKTAFYGKDAYAVCLKEDGRAIGAIELKIDSLTFRPEKSDDECELGFWIGKPFWGQGLIPEAGRAMLRRAFGELGMSKVWCGYYDGNEKSKRAQEKLGFKYSFTVENADVPLLGEKRSEHINCITKEDFK